jgi:hypothetical protein
MEKFKVTQMFALREPEKGALNKSLENISFISRMYCAEAVGFCVVTSPCENSRVHSQQDQHSEHLKT